MKKAKKMVWVVQHTLWKVNGIEIFSDYEVAVDYAKRLQQNFDKNYPDEKARVYLNEQMIDASA